MNYQVKHTQIKNAIDKAFSTLEKIVVSAPEACLPLQLAQKPGMNRATSLAHQYIIERDKRIAL